MNIITLDFESYYTTKGLGFRTQTTEEYIRDPDFEVIGASAQVNDGAPVWVSGSRETMRKWLATFDWRNSMLLAHNTLFDGAILHWVYGIKPAVYLDTLCIARAIHGVDAGGSLKALAERYQVGVKGEEVLNAIDKRRVDFTPEELARYGEYCCNDVMLTNRLFKEMSKDFPMNELRLIDMTLRMFIEPMLYVDQDKLSERLEAMHIEKSELLSSLKQSLKCETEEEVRKNLSSNAKFAKVLKDYGLTVPMKHSDKQKKDVPALAKKDEGFIALCESEDTYIQHLCAVRLGTKSTLEEGRIKRFMDIGRRNKGMIPVPLKYYGAHTGRWSGMDKINFQNLPSRDPKKKALKKAIVPPDGYVVINCDSSQIEARMVAWLAGQDDVVKQFADGEDVYSLFATAVYERTITKKDAEQRFVGKTCILGLGYGTGATKLQHTLATSQPISVKIDDDEAKRIVGVYRDKNDKIIDLWGEADRMLEDMMNGSFKNGPKVFGQHNCVYYDADGIILPNNLRIRYKNLRKEVDEDSGKVKTVYDSRRGTISIWGGAVVENVVQALARIVVGEQMIQINEHHRVALTVHDAAVLVVPEDEKDKATECVTGLMSVAPAWAQGLPVACEAHSGPSYGDC